MFLAVALVAGEQCDNALDDNWKHSENRKGEKKLPSDHLANAFISKLPQTRYTCARVNVSSGASDGLNSWQQLNRKNCKFAISVFRVVMNQRSLGPAQRREGFLALDLLFFGIPFPL